jgi:hypothetical protein
MDQPRLTARTLLGSLLSSISRSRRLEDRIRKLSAEAVAATDPVETNRILEELSSALRSHVERMRELASDRALRGERRRQYWTQQL